MKRAVEPAGHLTLFAGIFCKTWHVAYVGTLLPQHAHAHSHISLIMQGTVRVWAGAELLGDYHAPSAVKIAARVLHQFLTLTDDVTIACIHAVGEADGEPVVTEENYVDMED